MPLTKIMSWLGKSRISSYKAVFQVLYIKNIFTLYSEIKHNICYITQEKNRGEIFSGYPSFSKEILPSTFSILDIVHRFSSPLAPGCVQPMGNRGSRPEGKRKERSFSFGHGVAMAKVFYSRSQLCKHLSLHIPRFH